MKCLIVNGDDFGAGRGVNQGIIEAHRHGVLTSTSLMVTMPWSEEAAALGSSVLEMSVGLHVDLGKPGVDATSSLASDGDRRAELERQLSRFAELTGRLPTHIDSHRNVHRDPRWLPHFLDLANRYGVPLREHSPARHISEFYGQWDGETHPEQISLDGLIRILETKVKDGVNELMCHPGYPDPDFRSSYSAERATELRTLCDPILREALTERGIRLVSFRDLRDLQAGQLS